VQLNSSALDMLPVDDVPQTVLETLSEITRDTGDPGELNTTDEKSEYIPGEHVGYVDFNGMSMSSDVLEKTGFANAILRVPHGRSPVSEYTDSYWSGAFPVLFPYGRGLPNEPRQKSVSFSKWLRHCLSYKDHRFRHHPTFIFVSSIWFTSDTMSFYLTFLYFWNRLRTTC
jgi:hypothetical protein